MAKPKIHFIVSLILTRTKNLINTSRAKCNSKKNKNDSDKYILAWVPCDPSRKSNPNKGELSPW